MPIRLLETMSVTYWEGYWFVTQHKHRVSLHNKSVRGFGQLLLASTGNEPQATLRPLLFTFFFKIYYSFFLWTGVAQSL